MIYIIQNTDTKLYVCTKWSPAYTPDKYDALRFASLGEADTHIATWASPFNHKAVPLC